jgi:hypothetical protein
LGDLNGSREVVDFSVNPTNSADTWAIWAIHQHRIALTLFR